MYWLKDIFSYRETFDTQILVILTIVLISYYAISLSWLILMVCIHDGFLGLVKWAVRKSGHYRKIDSKLDQLRWKVEHFFVRTNPYNIFAKLKHRATSVYFILKYTLIGGIALGITSITIFPEPDISYEYLLLTSGTTTRGIITTINEGEAKPEDENDYFYVLNYTFFIGKEDKITSEAYYHASDLPSKFEHFNSPLTVEVVYLKNRPEVNRLKIQQSDSMNDFILKKVARRGASFVIILFILYWIIRTIKEM